MSRLPVNVECGVQLLDECKPDWRDDVDPYRLHMANTCGCVLGQVFGGYEEGLEALGLDDHVDASRFGFFVYGRQTWRNLEAAWRKVIG